MKTDRHKNFGGTWDLEEQIQTYARVPGNTG